VYAGESEGYLLENHDPWTITERIEYSSSTRIKKHYQPGSVGPLYSTDFVTYEKAGEFTFKEVRY
jgi:hypothetical protein